MPEKSIKTNEHYKSMLKSSLILNWKEYLCVIALNWVFPLPAAAATPIDIDAQCFIYQWEEKTKKKNHTKKDKEKGINLWIPCKWETTSNGCRSILLRATESENLPRGHSLHIFIIPKRFILISATNTKDWTKLWTGSWNRWRKKKGSLFQIFSFFSFTESKNRCENERNHFDSIKKKRKRKKVNEK